MRILVLACLAGLAYASPLRIRPTVNWSLHTSHQTKVNGGLGKTYIAQTDTYYSQAIPLKAGHMIYTEPSETPLTMPEGKYAITGFFGDIVDDQHNPVPLNRVYDHHWIAVSDKHRNQLCQRTGGLGNYVFGIGAESRDNPVHFPTGHAYVVEPGTKWGGNIHLLRTEGLAGNPHKAAKECNECYYGPNKGQQCTPQRNGTFQCCGEADTHGLAFCDTAEGPLPPEKNYHLRYNVTYTRDIQSVSPLEVGVMSAPDCAAFYGVLRNDENPVDTQSYQLRLPYDVHVALAIGHMHTGAINVTLSVNDKLACVSEPTYGTEEGVPGNEKGYLVSISPCIAADSGGLDLKKGDILKVEANYWVGTQDDRLLYSDGTHLNVMGYMYVAYSTDLATNSTLLNAEGTWEEMGASLSGATALQTALS